MEEKAKVVYQDQNILILNKSQGVVCTKEGRNSDDTLEDWIVERFGDNKLPRKGIVHRLDKGTSGLMLVAKNKETRNKILEMFKNREVKKTYWALIEGDLPRDGEIKIPISRSRYVFGRFAASVEGKNAETSFRLIKKYKKENKFYSLIEIDLKTGRTHQIRVHFSYLGWPLVGDLVYGGKELMGLKRPFLQSKKIEFELFDKRKLFFESDLATDLEMLLDKL